MGSHMTIAVKKRRAARRAPGSKGLALAVLAPRRPKIRNLIQRNLRAAHRLLSPALAELSVAVVDARQMGELHAQFLADLAPTDVLTFELEHDAAHRPTAGEVILCIDVAMEKARQHGVPVEQELLLYALHGMLHLCGYDDRTPAAYQRMHAAEDRILSRLGIGPVFSRPALGASAATGDVR